MTEAVAKKEQFQPLAPIGSAGNLKGLLERNQESLLALLPKHVTPERLMKTMLVAANRNPDILKCTQASVIETIQRAGELGLDLSGTLGEAYPVPFGNQLTLIPGYRGLAKLARQSGMVARIEAEAVHENDAFTYRKGSAFTVNFEPNLTGDRGNLRGFYAFAKLTDGSEQAEFMTVAEVEKIRQRANSRNSPAWKDSFSEMGRKTVFRRLAKWLPLSGDRWQMALAQDDQDYEEEPVIEVAPKKRGAAGLVERLVPPPADETPISTPDTAPVQGLFTVETGIPGEAWEEVRSLRDGRKRIAEMDDWITIFNAGEENGWTKGQMEAMVEEEIGMDKFNKDMVAKVVAIFGSFGAR